MRRALDGLSAWTVSVLAWTFRARRKRLDAELLAFGGGFRGRLPDEVLDDALEYVDFNEPPLAVEILADQLGEYDVRLTREEWERLPRLHEFWGGDPTSRRVFAALDPTRESSEPPP